MEILLVLTTALLSLATICQARFLDRFSRDILPPAGQKSSTDNGTVVSSLKEALAIGTERAVRSVSRPDGYFGNQMIKILLPERLQQAADLLGKAGYQKQVDDLVLNMNRAAEKAAPAAVSYFGDAIRTMTLEGAKGILGGGDTAATKFFEKKTRAVSGCSRHSSRWLSKTWRRSALPVPTKRYWADTRHYPLSH